MFSKGDKFGFSKRSTQHTSYSSLLGKVISKQLFVSSIFAVKNNKFIKERPSIKEENNAVWYEKLNSKERCAAYREADKRRVATYTRHDPYMSVIDHFPNNSTAYESYQRLKGPKRPVKNLLCCGPFKRKFKPKPYITESASFYKFLEEYKGAKFPTLVHKDGYLPDSLATKPPADKIKDGLFLEVFLQFAPRKNKQT